MLLFAGFEIDQIKIGVAAADHSPHGGIPVARRHITGADAGVFRDQAAGAGFGVVDPAVHAILALDTAGVTEIPAVIAPGSQPVVDLAAGGDHLHLATIGRHQVDLSVKSAARCDVDRQGVAGRRPAHAVHLLVLQVSDLAQIAAVSIGHPYIGNSRSIRHERHAIALRRENAPVRESDGAHSRDLFGQFVRGFLFVRLRFGCLRFGSFGFRLTKRLAAVSGPLSGVQATRTTARMAVRARCLGLRSICEFLRADTTGYRGWAHCPGERIGSGDLSFIRRALRTAFPPAPPVADCV